MTYIIKNNRPSDGEVDSFLKNINFRLPLGFMDFFKERNGAILISGKKYIQLFPLTEMFALNRKCNIPVLAPGFFIFGLNKGDKVYGIAKNEGGIYEMPFNDIAKEKAVFLYKTFVDFLDLPAYTSEWCGESCPGATQSGMDAGDFSFLHSLCPSCIRDKLLVSRLKKKKRYNTKYHMQ